MTQLKEKDKKEKRMLLDKLDINWSFTRWETLVFQMMWRGGESIGTIAEKLDRPILEIGLLIIEQAELGNIKQRKHGLF